ncbi:MAG: hypothetical protein ACRDPC_10260 [Solirubrobacteraceae bacterium]
MAGDGARPAPWRTDVAARAWAALHLASALLLPRADLTVGTWDRHLHRAVAAQGVSLLPEQLP